MTMTIAHGQTHTGGTKEAGDRSSIIARRSGRKLAPHLRLGELRPPAHVVQLYTTDDFLVDQVSDFIGKGLRARDACVVIATPTHRDLLEQRLVAKGLDLAAARERGTYISLDAATMLARVMVDGALDAHRFTEVVGGLIAQAAAARGRRHLSRPVQVFGEMAALLWAEGNRAAALRMEELGNALSEHTAASPLSLCCAYPMSAFAGEVREESFRQICDQHTHIIPAESYTALADPDERLRAITLLQQKASSLEAEVAQRKEVEERLHISENFYRHLFETSTDGILMVAPYTQTILQANPVMSDLLGYTREELLGRKLWQVGLFPDRETTLALWHELEERPIARREVVALPARDGQPPRYVELVCNRFHANDHEVIQCHLRDITQRKQAEEAQKRLEERKDAFISATSHELKTPVTSLKAFTQILQRRFRQQATEPKTDPQALHILERMDTELNRLMHLISDLLDLSKIQTGVLAFEETHFDLDDLVRDTVDDVQAAITTHHLRVEDATHGRINGDRQHLGQALTNLLVNAVKYSPEAETVIVRLSGDHEYADVAVRDFGIGISQEHQERIFERFYQVRDAPGNTYPGLGIGLYIARTVVERHGGRLWVESRPGIGSTFHVRLPLSRGPEDASCPTTG